MIKYLLMVGILAGTVAGVGATTFQFIYTSPLILEAETFEVAESEAPAHEAAAHSHVGDTAGMVAHSHEGDEAWAPADGMERAFYTLVANILAGIGFSMLLVGAMWLRGSSVDLRTGPLWGAGGFFAFSLAPFFGLPPELPGMVAADLASRQVWWVATVLASAVGLSLLVFPMAFLPSKLRLALGALLLVAPHAIGAPQISGADDHASLVPAHLASEFAITALMQGLVQWLLIGGVAGWLLGRAVQRTALGKHSPQT